MRKVTGVLLAAERREEKDSVINLVTGLLVLLFYYYLGLFGCTRGLLSLFPVECDRQILYTGMLLMGAFFFIICCTRKYAPVAVFLTALVYSWLLYRNWEMLLEGASAIFETVSRGLEYYRNGQRGTLMAPAGFERETALCLIAFSFLWSSLLFAGLVIKGGRFFAMIDVTFVLVVGLIVGEVPDFLSICLMVFCLTGAFSTDGMETISGQKTGTLFLAGSMCLLFLLGDMFLEPLLEPMFAQEKEIRAKIQSTAIGEELGKKLSEWKSSWSRAGANEGDLGNADFVTATNETVLEVRAEILPQETFYLKCYTGTDYTGSSWEASPDSMDAQVGENYFQKVRNAGLSEPFGMSVQVIRQEGDYLYQPYFSSFVDGEEEYKEYLYYPRSSVISWYQEGALGTEGPGEYQNYVYDHYLSYPKERLQRLQIVCDVNPQGSVEEISEFIVNYLRENAVYNLNVGSFPEGEEFAEYFLFEQHEGYCVHFATTAALMFRMYGIPSRYVTGYAVNTADFQYESAEYVARVPDSRAHAWTEIYIPGQGWIPAEATPGYGLAEIVSQPQTELLESEAISEEENSTENQTERQEEHPESPEKMPEESEKSHEIQEWVKGLLSVLGCILAGILTVMVRRMWILKKRSRADVKSIFRDICDLLEYAGFKEELEEEEVYVKKAVEQFPWLSGEEFEKLVRLAMQANFGRKPMTKEETQFTRHMYRRIRTQVEQSLNSIQKISFHLFWVL